MEIIDDVLNTHSLRFGELMNKVKVCSEIVQYLEKNDEKLILQEIEIGIGSALEKHKYSVEKLAKLKEKYEEDRKDYAEASVRDRILHHYYGKGVCKDTFVAYTMLKTYKNGQQGYYGYGNSLDITEFFILRLMYEDFATKWVTRIEWLRTHQFVNPDYQENLKCILNDPRCSTNLLNVICAPSNVDKWFQVLGDQNGDIYSIINAIIAMLSGNAKYAKELYELWKDPNKLMDVTMNKDYILPLANIDPKEGVYFGQKKEYYLGDKQFVKVFYGLTNHYRALLKQIPEGFVILLPKEMENIVVGGGFGLFGVMEEGKVIEKSDDEFKRRCVNYGIPLSNIIEQKGNVSGMGNGSIIISGGTGMNLCSYTGRTITLGNNSSNIITGSSNTPIGYNTLFYPGNVTIHPPIHPPMQYTSGVYQ
jgi:hypothetical protein